MQLYSFISSTLLLTGDFDVISTTFLDLMKLNYYKDVLFFKSFSFEISH